jgi:DeoR family transcriptional regulator, fructose operon transcriptional repressor
MFHDEKLEKILELLQIQPYWKSAALAKRLGISKSTVQRCLLELHSRGIAERIHGGIRRKNHALHTPISLDERLSKDSLAKERIAVAAVKLMPSDGFIYLDAGTTILPLAQAMAKMPVSDITVVTNDVAITLPLARQNITHILLGGRLHPVTQSLSGPLSQSQILEFAFQICFISADGIDSDGNVTSPLADEAMLKRAAIKNSAKKVLLAASSKWNNRTNVLITKLRSFDIWVTDKASAAMKSACRRNDVNLIVTDNLKQ